MTAKEMFNELTWISDNWDGEHISFNKDSLEGYLQEIETKIQNTSSNSEYMAALNVIEEYKQATPRVVRSCLGVECFAKQRLNQRR